VRGCDFLAVVEEAADGGVIIDAKAKFAKDEKIMLLTPDMNEVEIIAGAIFAMNGIEEINTKPGMKYKLEGLSAPEGSLLRRYA